jgi:hypothetical protein
MYVLCLYILQYIHIRDSSMYLILLLSFAMCPTRLCVLNYYMHVSRVMAKARRSTAHVEKAADTSVFFGAADPPFFFWQALPARQHHEALLGSRPGKAAFGAGARGRPPPLPRRHTHTRAGARVKQAMRSLRAAPPVHCWPVSDPRPVCPQGRVPSVCGGGVVGLLVGRGVCRPA